MNEIEITVCGNVCSDLTRKPVAGDREVTTFRIATSRRTYRDGKWTDGPTTFMSVGCFGALGRNVFASVHRGDPVVVHGRLQVRTWEHDGVRHTSVDIEAASVGHDLVLGTAAFQRTPRATAAAPEADPWAGVDPALADVARDAGLSPERALQDAGGAAA